MYHRHTYIYLEGYQKDNKIHQAGHLTKHRLTIKTKHKIGTNNTKRKENVTILRYK